MSKFGWSYPPGCSGPPDDPEPSQLQEEVLALLEEAGIDSRINDQIMNLIIEAEIRLAAKEPPK
jgi:hypothetical protein